MASSPFGCNQKNLFGSKAKPQVASVPEPVGLVAEKNQVITALIPFQTKKAAEVRQHMHANIIENGQKIFIYRAVNGWTNISLESTETSPKLTCDPITTLKTAYREFTNCGAVSKVTIKWKGSDNELGYDDIDAMEPEFDPLPEETADTTAAGGSKTDAEVLYDMIAANDKSIAAVLDKVQATELRLNYIVDIIDKLAGKIVAEPPATPTTNALGKRKKSSK